MNKILLLSFIVAVCGCGVVQKDLEISQIKGLWEVDYELTMEEVKKSPKYNEEDTNIPNIIKRMMATMRIRITDKDMIYIRKGKEVSIPYTFKSSDTTSITIAVKQGTNEATIVFNLRDKNHMNFKSSATDDMNYYIWKRSSEKHEN